MNTSVDVLRTLDQTDAALATAGLPNENILRIELREARAAVAELIEADAAYDQARTYFDNGWNSADDLKDAQTRRAAALARTTGAQS